MNTPYLSVIMPALNEERNISQAIRNCLEAFEEYSINGEIIIVNDGSTDKTQALVDDLIKKDSCITIIKHEIPQGIGASFWEGVDNAKGNLVVIIPGDNENNPWEIFRYHKLLEHVDIVVPFVFNKEVRPLFRNALSFIYRFIINTTFAVHFNYTNGTIICRKSVLKELSYRGSGFFFITDILIRSVKRGYLFAEVPYRLNVRDEEISKAVSFPSLMHVMQGYIRLIRDIYYHKREKTLRKTFAVDSLTFKRQKDNNVDE